MLLFKAAPNLDESLDRVTPDGEFQALAEETNARGYLPSDPFAK